MSMRAMDPAHKRYVIRTWLFTSGYVALNVAASTGAFDEIIGTPAGWLFGLTVAALVAGQMWATMRLIAESDEFVRLLNTRRFVAAAGLAMALFAAWGFMESYGDAPHAPGWLIYLLFWGLFGLVSPFIRTTR